MAGYAHPEMLIETAELAERLGDPNLRLVDGDVYDMYRRAHIPGAVPNKSHHYYKGSADQRFIAGAGHGHRRARGGRGAEEDRVSGARSDDARAGPEREHAVVVAFAERDRAPSADREPRHLRERSVWRCARAVASRRALVDEDYASVVRETVREETFKGPPASVAYDNDGKPTRAAEGFARTNGVAVEDLTTEESGGRAYVVARKRVESRPAGLWT